MNRSFWRVAALVAVTATVAFAPYLVGRLSLMEASSLAPSLYPAGARTLQRDAGVIRTADPGAPAWQNQAWLAVEHELLYVEHQIPWWNPYEAYGIPFLAAAQTQPFYPLTILAALHPSPRVWAAFAVARLVICGVFAAAFVRMFAGTSAALTTGIGATFGGYFLLYIGMPHLSSETLLPGLLWATERLLRDPERRNVATLALVWAGFHLGGMPESTAIGAIGCTVYCAARVLTLRVGARAICAWIAGGVLGLAIGAVMLLPFFEFMAASFNVHEASKAGGSIVGLQTDDSVSLLRALYMEIAPLAYGPPVGREGFSGLRGFIGGSIAFLSMVALVVAMTPRGRTWHARGAVIALALIASAEFCKRMGYGPIAGIGAWPILQYVQFTKYGEVLFDIAGALLGGLGLAAIAEGRARLSDIGIGATAVTAVIAGGYLEARFGSAHHIRFLISATLIPLAAIVATAAMALHPIARRLVPIVVAAELIAAFVAPMFYTVAHPPPGSDNPYTAVPYARALAALDPDRRYRVSGVDGFLWPDWAGSERFYDVRTINALWPARYFPFLRAFIDAPGAGINDELHDRYTGRNRPPFTKVTRRWLDLSSVRYIVADAAGPPPFPGARRIYRADAAIWENPTALERAAVVHHVIHVEGTRDTLERLRATEFDPHRDATSEGARLNAPPGHDELSVLTEGAMMNRYRVRMQSPGLVVTTSTWYPGWTVSVDGHPAVLERVDYLFRGVRVAGGDHIVEETYSPTSGAVGVALSLVALAITAFMVTPRLSRPAR